MPSASNMPMLVWYVDDDTQTSNDIIRYWKSLASLPCEPRPYEFHHFSTARAAWEALQAADEIPRAVIVDGHLDSDEGEFAEGARFIRRVRSSGISDQPLLLAFSGDEFAIKEMERVGADAGFYKGNVRSVLDYLTDSVPSDMCDSNSPKKSK